MEDKRFTNGVKVSFEALSTPEKVDEWLVNALRKNALSAGDKRIVQELVSFFKRKFEEEKDIELRCPWFGRALKMPDAGNAMYSITWNFNRMFGEGLFSDVDLILKTLKVETVSVEILISILTCAAWAKDKLVHRVEFFNRVKEHLISINRLEPGLLEGLE
jgi:hypothetical protein